MSVRGELPDTSHLRWAYRREFVLNSVVNRIPSMDLRMRLYARAGLGLEDPASTSIFRGTWMSEPQLIAIGARTVINRWCHLDGRGTLRIGHDVGLAERVMVSSATHGFDEGLTDHYVPTRIESHVFVNPGAFVFAGVTLGEGAVVAAGAVVTKDVEPWTIVAGVPARPIKQRPEQRYELGYRPNWR